MKVLKLLNGMKKNKEIDVNQIVGVELLNGKNCISVMFDEFALDYNGETTVVNGVATVDQIVEANKSMKKYVKTMNDVLTGKEIISSTTAPAIKGKIENPISTTPEVPVNTAPVAETPVTGTATKREDWFSTYQWGKISKENKEILKAHFKAGTMTTELQNQILSFISAKPKTETPAEKPAVNTVPELPALDVPEETPSLEIPQLNGLQ